MITRVYRVEDIRYLFIGRQGENLASTITFDVRTFRVKGGTVEMYIQRPGEDCMYNATNELHDEGRNRISWSPTIMWTQFAGKGKIILRSVKDGKMVKSQIFETEVEESLLFEPGEQPLPPDPPDPPTPGGGWTAEQINLLDLARIAFGNAAKHLVYKDEDGVPGYAFFMSAVTLLQQLCESLRGSLDTNLYIIESGGETLRFTSIYADTCTFGTDGSVTIH